MRSRIRVAAQKKVLAVNVDKDKLERLGHALLKEGVEIVCADKNSGGETVGHLLGYSGFAKSDDTGTASENTVDKELVLFSGIDNKSLNRVLAAMRANDCAVDLKAVVTAVNQKWTLSELAREIEREHIAMNGGSQNG